jgi:hypothetical protein
MPCRWDPPVREHEREGKVGRLRWAAGEKGGPAAEKEKRRWAAEKGWVGLAGKVR